MRDSSCGLQRDSQFCRDIIMKFLKSLEQNRCFDCHASVGEKMLRKVICADYTTSFKGNVYYKRYYILNHSQNQVVFYDTVYAFDKDGYRTAHLASISSIVRAEPAVNTG
ncbi:unnamed protein product [Allacma fusca]|uniref:Uncharacterized protein n=1 Tax=Allacma fusca TaxID=39272 RepID=A0A8J2K9V6_9HEXA|nr:unnamed protein product [Allacma fusca]